MRTIVYSSEITNPVITSTDSINNLPGTMFTSITGLYLADDSSNPLTSTLGTGYYFNTTDKAHYVISGSTTPYSIGLDMGAVVAMQSATIWDTGAAGKGIYTSGSHDTLSLYISNNNSTWVARDTYDLSYYRKQYYSGSGLTGPIYDTYLYNAELPFSGTYSARYLKFYASNGPVRSYYGAPVTYSCINVYAVPSATVVSGSNSNIYDHSGQIVKTPTYYSAGA